jgi:serine/threonine-protein kinase
MGEVWRARDTRLRREVAIKALPPALAQEPERLARLKREAELLASLNHPHIATIHGLEEQEGAPFLVLELVEGGTLDARLLRGPLPIDEALQLALQIAQALEAAHGKGIIHRDLKPANIKITPDRRVKVLDFGIAKAIEPGADDVTATHDMTNTGTVIGTPAYMSPEQARGETVGTQSDIWSFGVVLYQMLTAKSPFQRRTAADTIASVLDAQPNLSALPPGTPPIVRRLVQRCLENDRSRRIQHIGDGRILIEEALAAPNADASRGPAPKSTARPALLLGTALGLLLAGSGFWITGSRWNRAVPTGRAYVSIPFVGQPFVFSFGTRHLAISPDGSTVAVVSGGRLWIRRMDRQNTISVSSTPAHTPFFSPDGEWIGWFQDTAMIKVPVSGGTPVTITTTSDRPLGAAWREDDTIVFATTEGLLQIPAAGGKATSIAKPDRSQKERVYAWPQLLPGGQKLLFTVVPEDPKSAPRIHVLDLRTKERQSLVAGSSAIYGPRQQLFYVSDSKLNAVRFDVSTNAIEGKPTTFPEIELAVSTDTGAANFAVSNSGTLIYSAPSAVALRTLAWIDRHGSRETIAVEPQAYGYAMVSPDGTRIAVERTTRGNRDVWIIDLARLTQTQLTDGPTEDMLPTWSPDSTRVYFASNRTGNFDVYSQAADGASPARLEFAAPEFQAPSAVTPDGSRVLVYDRFQDLALLDLAKRDRLEPLLHSSFDERLGQVAPDGQWIAYESDESGDQFEIVLRSFPDVKERRETISIGGGRYPRWGPRGSNELFYVNRDGAMMSVPIHTSPKLSIGRPQKLFDWQKPPPARSGLFYDVAPDGRFLVTKATATSADTQTNVSVILNFDRE